MHSPLTQSSPAQFPLSTTGKLVDVVPPLVVVVVAVAPGVPVDGFGTDENPEGIGPGVKNDGHHCAEVGHVGPGLPSVTVLAGDGATTGGLKSDSSFPLNALTAQA